MPSLAPQLGCDRQAFRTEWKALRPAVVMGRVSFRQALIDITTKLGGNPEGVTVERLCNERRHAKAEPFQQIEHQVLTMLDGLRRRGLRLGVISNCLEEDVAAWAACPLASRFDSTVFSFEVGAAKPDPEIYREATRRLRVRASETWFIGDGADGELRGAQQAGLRAFKALWFLMRWPHYREEPWDATVATVEDVVRLVT